MLSTRRDQGLPFPGRIQPGQLVPLSAAAESPRREAPDRRKGLTGTRGREVNAPRHGNGWTRKSPHGAFRRPGGGGDPPPAPAGVPHDGLRRPPRRQDRASPPTKGGGAVRARRGLPRTRVVAGVLRRLPAELASLASRSERLGRALVAITAAWFAADPWTPCRPPAGLCRCWRKACKHALHSGPEATLKVLKEHLDESRLAWLSSAPFNWSWLGSGVSRGRAPPAGEPRGTHPADAARARRARVPDTLVAQLSMAKRALPTPSGRDVRKAVRAHFQSLTTPYESDPAYLGRAAAFAERWARRYLRPGPLPLANSSESACWERTRKEGGQRAALEAQRFALAGTASARREEREVDYVSWAVAGSLHRDLGEVAQETTFAAEYRRAYREVCSMGLAPAKVEVVEELGLKARIVTKSPVSLTTLAHQARRRLLNGLRRTPEIGLLLCGDVRGALKRFEGATGQILSSDFRAATDLLPLDLCTAVVEGVLRSGCFTTAEAVALAHAIAPMEGYWPTYVLDGAYRPASAVRTARGVRARTCRGVLMGLPTSWSILNLCHLFWWHEAQAGLSPDARRMCRFACFGDDALVVAPPDVLDAYEQACTRGGMELSPGKHARTLARGVFLENLVEISGPRGHTRPVFLEAGGVDSLQRRYRTDWASGREVRITQGAERLHDFRRAAAGLPVAPLRDARIRPPQRVRRVQTLLVNRAIPLRGLLWSDGGKELLHRQDAPAWATAGAAVEALSESYDRERIFRVQKGFLTPLVAECLRRRVPSLPRLLGGSGFLRCGAPLSRVPIGACASRRHRKAVRVAATRADGALASGWSRAWSLAAKAAPDWVFELSKDPSEVALHGTPVPYGPLDEDLASFQRVGDLPRRVSLFLMVQALAAGAVPSPTQHWPLSRVADAVHRTRDQLVQAWPGVQLPRGEDTTPVSYWEERVRRAAARPAVLARTDPIGRRVNRHGVLDAAYTASPLGDDIRGRIRLGVQAGLGGQCFLGFRVTPRPVGHQEAAVPLNP